VARHESKFYQDLKKITPTIRWTRLENWALFGTPDLLGYSSRGTFFTVELKSTSLKKSNFVRCSPHQISFHMKHKKNTFILVACSQELGHFRLYSGSRILELVDLGLKLEPLACGLVPSVTLLEGL